MLKGQNIATVVEGQEIISAPLSPVSKRVEDQNGLLNRDIMTAKDSIVGNFYVPPSRLQPYQDIMSKEYQGESLNFIKSTTDNF